MEYPATRSRRARNWFRRFFDFGVDGEIDRERSRMKHRQDEYRKRFVFRKTVITQTDALFTVDNSGWPHPKIKFQASARQVQFYQRHDVDQLPPERVLEELRKRLPIDDPADLKKPIDDVADSMDSREIRILMDRDAARTKAREATRAQKMRKKIDGDFNQQRVPRIMNFNQRKAPRIMNSERDGRANKALIRTFDCHRNLTDASSNTPVQPCDKDDPSQLEHYQKVGAITKAKARDFLQQQRKDLEKAREEQVKILQGERVTKWGILQKRPNQKPLGGGKQDMQSPHTDEYRLIRSKEGLDSVPETLTLTVQADLQINGHPRSETKERPADSPAPKNAFFRSRARSALVKQLSSASAGSLGLEEPPSMISETNMIEYTTSTAQTTTIAMRTTTVSKQIVRKYTDNSTRTDSERLPYYFGPLEGVEQFRLLSVETLAQSDDFTYELRTFSMNNAPPYETVSYVWGLNNRDFLLSFKDSTVLHITGSLFSALPLLSRHCRSGYLWIDQICIDQSNLSERNHQVKYMGDIYKRAEKVFIFLGPMSPVIDPEGLLTLLHHVEESRSKASSFTTAVRLQSLLEKFILPDYNSSLHSARHWRDIVRLFQHPWFTRAWVFQELVLSNIVLFALDQRLASLEAMLDLGNIVADLESRSLPAFQHDLCLTRSPGFQQLRLMANVRIRRITRGRIDPDLFWNILSQVAPICQSSNEQDTLYAFLGLLEDPRIDIWPDYSKSVSDTFFQAASAVIDGQESLDLLAYVDRALSRVDRDRSRSMPSVAIPSWVPDWRLAQSVKIFNREHFSAARGRKYEPAFAVDDNLRPFKHCLCTRGCSVDKVIYVATSSFYSAKPWESRDPCSFLNLDEHLDRLIRHFGKSLGKPQQLLQRLLLVALADGSEGSRSALHPWKVRRFLETYQRYGHTIAQQQTRTGLDKSDSTTPEPCRLFLKELRQLSCIASGRRLFATKNLRLGLGPESTSVGDDVCVLHGSSLPVVLHGMKYVKGQCFLEGIMHGEAVKWSEEDAPEIWII